MTDTQLNDLMYSQLMILQSKADKLNSDDFKNFWEYYYKRAEITQPIEDWAYDMYYKALESNNITNNDELFAEVNRIDNALADAIGTDMPEDKRKVLAILKTEDPDVKIYHFLDYDCDTTLSKFTVVHEKSGIRYRGAKDLGTKFLSTGICINVE